MVRALVHGKRRDFTLIVLLLAAAGALLRFPEQSMQAGRQGLQLCANVIIPSLFPFFVLSSLAVELGLAQYLGLAAQRLMYPLFRVNGAGASALILGFVGGYPVGARTAISLYESGLCSKTETERMLAFCNNSGPAFILGVVGTGVFASGRVGLLLYLTHIAASLCVGLLFRFYGGRGRRTPAGQGGPPFRAARFSAAFTSAVRSSAGSVLNICAFILLFTVVIRLLFVCGIMGFLARLAAVLLAPLGGDLRLAEQLLTGLLEVSSGVTGLSGSGAAADVSMAAFMLGWAGLSVHCQVLSFLSDSGLSSGTYLTGKALHGVLSALFAALLTRVFPLETPVTGYLAQQVGRLAALDFSGALVISSAAAWAVWVAFFLLSAAAVRAGKKKSGNRRGHGV